MSIAAALQQYCSSFAAVLQQFCSSTPAVLQLAWGINEYIYIYTYLYVLPQCFWVQAVLLYSIKGKH
jgi:hypothetical protein